LLVSLVLLLLCVFKEELRGEPYTIIINKLINQRGKIIAQINGA